LLFAGLNGKNKNYKNCNRKKLRRTAYVSALRNDTTYNVVPPTGEHKCRRGGRAAAGRQQVQFAFFDVLFAKEKAFNFRNALHLDDSIFLFNVHDELEEHISVRLRMLET
jgi:hypothetical protein